MSALPKASCGGGCSGEGRSAPETGKTKSMRAAMVAGVRSRRSAPTEPSCDKPPETSRRTPPPQAVEAARPQVIGPMDYPQADPEMDTGYYKTRVQRVFASKVQIAATTTTVRRIWFRPEQMQRDDLVDAKTGLLYALITWSGQLAVTAQVLVIWEIPESPNVYTPLITPITSGQVTQIVAWDQPTPGRVGIEIHFTNTGGAGSARVDVDLCAKRVGSNFQRGMWFRDIDAEAKVPQAIEDWSPEPEVSLPLRRPRSPCAPRFLPLPTGVGTEASDASLVSAMRSDQGLHSIIPAKGLPCDEPDPIALDWIQAIEDSALDGGRIPDPEVERAEAVLGWPLAPFTAGPAGGIDLSVALTALGINPNALPSTFTGRCPGFEAKWRDVSQGLDFEKMPVRRIDQIFGNGIGDFAISWGLAVTLAPLTGLSAAVLGAEALDEDRLADISRRTEDFPGETEWQYLTTAPWLDGVQRTRVSWYMANVLSLLWATLDLAPTEVVSPRQRGRANRLSRDRSDWRILAARNPNWRISIRDVDLNPLNGPEGWLGMSDVSLTPFNVTTCTWGVPARWPLRGTRAITVPLPSPIPSIMFINTWSFAPFIDAAARAYQVARLLTMIATTHESAATLALLPNGVNVYNQLIAVAKDYFAYYLGCLVSPARNVVHELYHMLDRGTLSTEGRAGLRYVTDGLAAGILGSHCSTGCGQEKLAGRWAHAFGQDFRCAWPAFNTSGAGSSFPTNLNLGPGTAATNNSDCRSPAGSSTAAFLTWTSNNFGDAASAGAVGYTESVVFATRTAGVFGSSFTGVQAPNQDRVERIQRRCCVRIQNVHNRKRMREDRLRLRIALATRPGQEARLRQRLAEQEARFDRIEQNVRDHFNKRIKRATYHASAGFYRRFLRKCWDNTSAGPGCGC